MSNLIDRQAVELRINELLANESYTEEMLRDDIHSLPSAEPERVVCAEVKLSKEEIQEAVDDAVKKMMAEMGEPERKKGKWIWSDEDASWKCGSCDCVFEEFDWKPEYNYCPNCGCDMRGEEDEIN